MRRGQLAATLEQERVRMQELIEEKERLRALETAQRQQAEREAVAAAEVERRGAVEVTLPRQCRSSTADEPLPCPPPR